MGAPGSRRECDSVTQVSERIHSTIPVTGFPDMRAVLVVPDGEPPSGGWPGVLVLHEVFGLQQEIIEVGERFAARGWAALVPDYFSLGGKLGCLVRAAREVQTHRPGRIIDALVAATRHLGGREDIDADRLAVIGFCLGGGFALLLGVAGPDGLKAVAANYGDVPAEELMVGMPPVVASYGGRDLVIGGKAAPLRDRLARCGVEHDVKVYDDAGHSFMTEGHHPLAELLLVPLHPGFVAGAARDAWARVFAFLDEHVR